MAQGPPAARPVLRRAWLQAQQERRQTRWSSRRPRRLQKPSCISQSFHPKDLWCNSKWERAIVTGLTLSTPAFVSLTAAHQVLQATLLLGGWLAGRRSATAGCRCRRWHICLRGRQVGAVGGHS